MMACLADTTLIGTERSLKFKKGQKRKLVATFIANQSAFNHEYPRTRLDACQRVEHFALLSTDHVRQVFNECGLEDVESPKQADILQSIMGVVDEMIDDTITEKRLRVIERELQNTFDRGQNDVLILHRYMQAMQLLDLTRQRFQDIHHYMQSSVGYNEARVAIVMKKLGLLESNE